jgi:iron complex transport system permease protein
MKIISKGLLLFIFLFGGFFISIISGSAKLSLVQIAKALILPQDVSEPIKAILWKVRLPRIVAGMLIGAGLAGAGCVFQGILRNPLAEPYTLGVSAGAAFGACLGIISGSGYLPAWAFMGALFAIGVVYSLSSAKSLSIHAMILCGVIISIFFSSLILLLFALSEKEDVHKGIFWLMGNLSNLRIELLAPVALMVSLGLILIMSLARRIDILTLGEEKSRSLGLIPSSQRGLLFVITSLVVAGCVSMAGMIGFVGLIIPHFMRYLFGPSHMRLIITSAIGGAGFLIICDTIGRTIISPAELPVGIITGLFGSLFFLGYLLRKGAWESF